MLDSTEYIAEVVGDSVELEVKHGGSVRALPATSVFHGRDFGSGLVAEGKTNMSDYTDHQPWPVGEVAKTLS